jgi:hypothetical protein
MDIIVVSAIDREEMLKARTAVRTSPSFGKPIPFHEIKGFLLGRLAARHAEHHGLKPENTGKPHQRFDQEPALAKSPSGPYIRHSSGDKVMGFFWKQRIAYDKIDRDISDRRRLMPIFHTR